MMRRIAVLAIISSVLFSCEEDNIPLHGNIYDAYEFVPHSEGSGSVYLVDSILVYRQSGAFVRDTSQWFIRDSIIGVDTLHDSQMIYHACYKRKKEQNPWVFDYEYSIIVDDQWVSYQGVDEAHVLFPSRFSESARFISNQFIDPFTEFSFYGENLKIYKDWSDSRLQVDSDSLLSVDYTNQENQIEFRSFKARYIGGLGLLASSKAIFDSQCIAREQNCDEIPWAEKADLGFQVTQTFVSQF